MGSKPKKRAALLDAITQVYLVTAGEYSSYVVCGVFLTLEEAQNYAGDWATVEVWPVGEHKRTLGTFYIYAQINSQTGQICDVEEGESPDLASDQPFIEVLYWPGMVQSGDTYTGQYAGQLGIRVECQTQKRAKKVYSEVKARVLNDITLGLPPEAIADCLYTGDYPNPWKRTAP